MNFLYLLFLSIHGAQQPRSGWPSNVLKEILVASVIGIEISPTSPLIFTVVVKKCEIWHRFLHQSTLSCPRLKMQQDS